MFIILLNLLNKNLNMSLSSNNVCFNCENLTASFSCKKHDLSVNLDNYCSDHNYKKSLNKTSNCGNCSKFKTDNCPNSNYASEGLLCFSWSL